VLVSVCGYSTKGLLFTFWLHIFFLFVQFLVTANMETGQKYKVLSTNTKLHTLWVKKLHPFSIAITVYCHSRLCHVCCYTLLWKSRPFIVALSSSVLIRSSDSLKESVRWANSVSSFCKCCNFWVLKFMKIECCEVVSLCCSSFWCRMCRRRHMTVWCQ